MYRQEAGKSVVVRSGLRTGCPQAGSPAAAAANARVLQGEP